MGRHRRHLLKVIKEQAVLLVRLHYLLQVVLVRYQLFVLCLKLKAWRLRLLFPRFRPLAKLINVLHFLLIIHEVGTCFREKVLINEFVRFLGAALTLLNMVCGLINMHRSILLIFEVVGVLFVVRWLFFEWLDKIARGQDGGHVVASERNGAARPLSMLVVTVIKCLLEIRQTVKRRLLLTIQIRLYQFLQVKVYAHELIFGQLLLLLIEWVHLLVGELVLFAIYPPKLGQIPTLARVVRPLM